MDSVLICPVKINVTLRILKRRPDGYHELFSSFWKKNGTERLTIREVCGENIADRLKTTGALIRGENILTKVLTAARKDGAHIPALEMLLEKDYPQGSGIGAGSGNAAALACFLKNRYGAFGDRREIAKLGADVAFLADGADISYAGGIGERLEPQEGVGGLCWILAFPRWQSNTAEAYAALDRQRNSDSPELTAADLCRREADVILAKLRNGEKAGLLPNDFLPVARAQHPEYDAALDAAADDSLACGLCGSGSAVFAVCGSRREAEKVGRIFETFDWIIKTSILE